MIVSSLIFYYITTVDDEILKITRMKVESINKETGLEIGRNIEESENDLNLLSEYASDYEINYGNAVSFLSSQSQVEEFDALFYVDTNGNAISSNNEEYDFSDNASFILAMNNEFVVTEPYVSSVTGEVVYNIAVPIMVGNDITGVLLSEVPIDELCEVMDDTVKSGWVFFVDYNMNILFSSNDERKEFAAVPQNDLEVLGLENVAKGTQNGKEGKAGSFSYETDYGDGTVQKILTYTPIEMTEWFLVVAIEESAVNIDLATSLMQITTIGFAILFVTIIFLIYLWLNRFMAMRSLEKTAYYDPLTNLPNLAKLKKNMTEVLNKNKDEKYSVVKIDIENFKAINELFGFEIGNRVLQSFKPIRDTVQEPTLQIARTGVDEFVLFSGNGFLDDMEKRTAIYESYYNKFIPELGDYHISFKYGRYHIPVGYTDVDEIINRLNLAHKISKGKKGLIIYDYNETYTEKLYKEAEITSKMISALKNNEFEIFLQPKISLKDDTIVGTEALVRWIEPNGNIMCPNDFIPLFEKNGFVLELDMYVFSQVCQTIRRWIDEGKTPLPVSVNCSRQNLYKSNLVNDYVEIANNLNVPHEYLEIELTESTTMEDKTLITKLFYDLGEAGFKISIDDFGSGYSSLGLIINLRADTLKLDKSFFDEEEEAERVEYVVGGFIKLAHDLSMDVVAEGIEKQEQINLLKKLDCDAVQGNYNSKPIPVSEFEEKYKDYLCRKSEN